MASNRTKALLVAINCHNVSWVTKLQAVIICSKLLALTGVIAIGFFWLGKVLLRWTEPDLHRPIKLPTALSAFLCLLNLAILFITVYKKPQESSIALVIIAFGLPAYLLGAKWNKPESVQRFIDNGTATIQKLLLVSIQDTDIDEDDDKEDRDNLLSQDEATTILRHIYRHEGLYEGSSESNQKMIITFDAVNTLNSGKQHIVGKFYQWCSWFKDGRTSLQDEPRSGRPNTANNVWNTARVDELIKVDRRVN
ncbi:histone-lysine N-methyltransferase SETMAR [Plakobranchus ocellatus]|uniref:Histone-lysine N-methyltransferase SETMAR n=1 Tax=Plakobranchus ocellatus TaxID=259542 RepID=A0AAV3YL42_9GAST|nr:histone-lysine N-methyltransferase SETMAR [Plakobranchus ocellatus]